MSLYLAGSKQLLLGKASDAFVATRNASVAEVKFVVIDSGSRYVMRCL